MSGNNDSDWLDDFIIMSMMEEDETEENSISASNFYSGGSSTSRHTASPSSKSNGVGCSTIFIVLAAIYIILNLLTN